MFASIEEAYRQFLLNNLQSPDCPQWVRDEAVRLGLVQQDGEGERRRR